MNNLDWNQLRAFDATATAGSLSAAARQLGLAQPTLSRQIAALEASLGLTLFERVGKRLVMTETGRGLAEHVRLMGEAAADTVLAASGRSEATAGRVSISATDAYAAYVLPEIVARIREEAPEVTVAIVASNAIVDLRRREADIALRHADPAGDDLFAKVVRRSVAGLWASQGWIDRHGPPATPADAARHLIGFDDPAAFPELMAKGGVPVRAEDLRIVSESAVVVWEMVRRGLGVGVMLEEIAARTPDVVEVLPEVKPAIVPLWLVTHRELRTSRRIRLVYDILAEALAD